MSISESIREERATRKNSQPAAAQRVAMKMGRRLRCSSFTYRFRYAPSNCQSGSDRLAGGADLQRDLDDATRGFPHKLLCARDPLAHMVLDFVELADRQTAVEVGLLRRSVRVLLDDVPPK